MPKQASTWLAIHGAPSPTACRWLSAPKPAFAAQRAHCRPLSSTPPAKCPPNTGAAPPQRMHEAEPGLLPRQGPALALVGGASLVASTTGTIEPSISPTNSRPCAVPAGISRARSCSNRHCAWRSVVRRAVLAGMPMP